MSLRERKKLAAWRAIRAAALRLFDEQGYETTTIEQIAAAADVSRATFFNYFASKEALLFDQDPEARGQWRTLLESRQPGEPLWDALTAIMLDVNEAQREHMALHRRLKAQSPALAQASQAFGEQLRTDLLAWIMAQAPGGDSMIATLQLNLALAACVTAYQSWQDHEDFDTYLQRLKQCLDQAGTGVATLAP
ncbi:TetR/AcrR family transcriptional regulator [Actinoplanes hulinensis]|uniref:TetR/AcrR family transcriptional regulator n=1 Tax=Actinoplanes hulinensis TaxID=1144547 RepID=A0ABS7B482_9ACTN|nr:TetR/AcrR family transcriptional regulator [Actinoplanes hulinensis]MBW6435835.1 TetR/AcrR family transcriptional regulator [Actinoplanes hulinensis]